MCLIIRTIEFRLGSQHLGLGFIFLLKNNYETLEFDKISIKGVE